MDPATVLGVVQRLAKRGLVAVRTDPDDGRRRLVQLTHDGNELAREVVAIGPGISRETLEGLSEQEQSDLLHLIDRLGRTGGGSTATHHPKFVNIFKFVALVT